MITLKSLQGDPENPLHEAMEMKRMLNWRFQDGGDTINMDHQLKKAAIIKWRQPKRKAMFAAEGRVWEVGQLNCKSHMSNIELQDLFFVLLGFSLALVWSFLDMFHFPFWNANVESVPLYAGPIYLVLIGFHFMRLPKCCGIFFCILWIYVAMVG